MPATSTDRLDGLTTSVAVKAPVRAVSTANLTLSGEQTVNGVPLVSGDRVLVKDQSIPSENGIYVVSTGSWVRSKDFDGNRDAVKGTLVVSNDGAGSIYYRVTTPNPITIGTTAINFEVVSGVLTQSIIGGLLYPQTAEESAASVIPTNYAYPPGNVLRYGVVGDGVTDDAIALAVAFSASDGQTLDFQGLTCATTASMAQTYSSNTALVNGRIKYIGDHTEYVVKVEAEADLTVQDFVVNANNLAAKGLWVFTTTENTDLRMLRAEGKNCLQTAATGFAAGIIATADTDQSFRTVELLACKATDINSSGGANVGRGLIVQDFVHCRITNADVRRVGPYQDGDGIYCATPNYLAGVLEVSDSYFEDCEKRSIKSQVANTTLKNIAVRRTEAFTVGTGQAEVDLQFGGTLDGLTCFYADGAAPERIISGWNPGLGVVLKNVTVKCADSTDTIKYLISLANNSDTARKGFIVENVTTNSLVRNVVEFYSSVGAANPATYIFDEVTLNNISVAGFSSETETAVCFVTRGASAYVQANVRAINCNFGPDSTVAQEYLDPNPGNTSFLAADFVQITNCHGFDSLSTVNTDAKQRAFAKQVSVAENAAATITVSMRAAAGQSARVTAFYASNRDSSTAKLYTEGMWFYGETRGYYVETVSGNKSQTGQGAIAVTASGSNIELAKTAGSTSSSGLLRILIQHAASVDE